MKCDQMKVCFYINVNGDCRLDECPYLSGELFSFTKYSREQIPKPEARLKVGDRVEFSVTTDITKVGKDCDGTVLYEAEMIGFGWSEEHFRKLAK